MVRQLLSCPSIGQLYILQHIQEEKKSRSTVQRVAVTISRLGLLHSEDGQGAITGLTGSAHRKPEACAYRSNGTNIWSTGCARRRAANRISANVARGRSHYEDLRAAPNVPIHG